MVETGEVLRIGDSGDQEFAHENPIEPYWINPVGSTGLGELNDNSSAPIASGAGFAASYIVWGRTHCKGFSFRNLGLERTWEVGLYLMDADQVGHRVASRTANLAASFDGDLAWAEGTVTLERGHYWIDASSINGGGNGGTLTRAARLTHASPAALGATIDLTGWTTSTASGPSIALVTTYLGV
jgi:hypothetical protein